MIYSIDISAGVSDTLSRGVAMLLFVAGVGIEMLVLMLAGMRF
jgi:hypothetical protein